MFLLYNLETLPEQQEQQPISISASNKNWTLPKPVTPADNVQLTQIGAHHYSVQLGSMWDTTYITIGSTILGVIITLPKTVTPVVVLKNADQISIHPDLRHLGKCVAGVFLSEVGFNDFNATHQSKLRPDITPETRVFLRLNPTPHIAIKPRPTRPID